MRRVARISNTSKSHRVEEMRHESDGGAAAPTVSGVPQIHREKYKGEVKGLSRSYANNCHRHHHCITGAADMIKYIIVAVIQCDIMTIIKQFVHQAVAFNYFFLHFYYRDPFLSMSLGLHRLSICGRTRYEDFHSGDDRMQRALRRHLQREEAMRQWKIWKLWVSTLCTSFSVPKFAGESVNFGIFGFGSLH